MISTASGSEGESVDEATRDALLQLLGGAMSDISEECYCAGWLGGTEYFVPELCRRAIASGVAQPWGGGEITPRQARGLQALAGLVGSWATLAPSGTEYVPFRPFPIPPEFLQVIDRERG